MSTLRAPAGANRLPLLIQSHACGTVMSAILCNFTLGEREFSTNQI